MADPYSKVPVLILAGGLGTRISEETQSKPKPMVNIGGIPILLHLMRSYFQYGFNDFVICAGYRSFTIKQFFIDYQAMRNDVEVDNRNSAESGWKILRGPHTQEPWRVRVLDTGQETMTGARISRALQRISGDEFEHFAVTYGDGLTDMNLRTLFDAHVRGGSIGTVLGVQNNSRYGELSVDPSTGNVLTFREKPENLAGLINGGFFFFKRQFETYLSPDRNLVLEHQPLERLSSDGQLRVHHHKGFWFAMDSLKDKNHLDEICRSGKLPWMTEGKQNETRLSLHHGGDGSTRRRAS